MVSSQNGQSESLQGQATPTDVMSPDGSRWSIGGKEAVQTNQKPDIRSPAPPTAPTDPPICDIITGTASSHVGGAKTLISTDPGKNAPLASAASSHPLGGRCGCERPLQEQPGSSGLGTSSASLLLQCQQLAHELERVVRQAVGLHQQVSFLSEASSSCLTVVLPR